MFPEGLPVHIDFQVLNLGLTFFCMEKHTAYNHSIVFLCTLTWSLQSKDTNQHNCVVTFILKWLSELLQDLKNPTSLVQAVLNSWKGKAGKEYVMETSVTT